MGARNLQDGLELALCSGPNRKWVSLADYDVALQQVAMKAVFRVRCRANMAHARQSRPDSGFGLQVQVLHTFQLVPCSQQGQILVLASRCKSSNLFKVLPSGPA